MPPQTPRPNVVTPSQPAQPSAPPSTGQPLPAHPPVPDPRRLGHSMPVGSQPTVTPGSLPGATPLFQAQPGAAPQNPYAFIMDPPTPPKQGLTLPGGLAGKIAMIGGGVLVLAIIVTVIRGILGGSPDLTPYIGLTQQQQELRHLSANVAQLQNVNLSQSTQDYAATSSLSLASNQDELIKYITTNGTKLDPKVLNLKLSASIDKQLTDAQTNGTYDQTFKSVVKDELNTYSAQLQQVYKSAGPKGKVMIKSHYDQAQLLLQQLDTGTSSGS